MSPEHYTKLTTEAAIFCPKCMKVMMWRVADGRRQWCITCYNKPKETKPEKIVPQDQPKLF